jgi:hypothetical protein
MALSSGSVVIAQDAPEALPTMHFAGVTPDLGTRVDQAIAEALVMALPNSVRSTKPRGEKHHIGNTYRDFLLD